MHRLIAILLVAQAFCARAADDTQTRSITSAPRDPPTVWMGPRDSVPRPPLPGIDDYMDLFRPDSQWQTAASHVRVFKIYKQFIGNASDSDLRALFQDLRRRKIALAMEGMILTTSDKCGEGVEAFEGPNESRSVERIKQLGGNLEILALDEPLYFGHEYKGHNACHYSIQAVAQDVAKNLRMYRVVFPDLKVGDIEPVLSLTDGDMANEIAQWIDAYRSAVGEPLAFLHADIDWNALWAEPMRDLAVVLRHRHVPLGVIYNASPEEMSDERWVENARMHFEEFEDAEGSPPDHVIFQSWTLNPTHVLPETSPGTMTYLIDSYYLPKPLLHKRVANARVLGRATTIGGRAVPNLEISLEALDSTQDNLFEHAIVQGVVPQQAASALVGIRVNTECICAGHSDFTIASVDYREVDNGKVEQRQNFAQQVSGRDNTALVEELTGGTVEGPLLRVRASKVQSLSLGTPSFAVTPRADFYLSFPIHVATSQCDNAFLALIFLNSQNKEVDRVNFVFRPGFSELARTTTDSQGRFELEFPDDFKGSLRNVRIRAKRTALYRGTASQLAPSVH